VLTALRFIAKINWRKLSPACKPRDQPSAILPDEMAKSRFRVITHTRKAMPSSVAMWAGALHDALSDDLDLLHCAMKLIDQNPLGTGAGLRRAAGA
jgi:argininosuccinate lyase